ncbi:uncharacterized protein LOC127874991 isoform X4 [Dreissena polymorpha]|uniref:uncharacterized protein LOC127874991 isoform X4 n=1 Tax=Dreissena polymorpha TaxID=45954 RepID=UPI002263B072|nr:uncharacterized protein LOC127874991 isoform X4 [Dreissena polymorpha]
MSQDTPITYFEEMKVKPEVVEAWGDDSAQTSKLKKLIRPLLIAMALCGCYNFSDIMYIVHGHSCNAKNALSSIYRFVYLVIILIMCIKYGVCLHYASSENKLLNVLAFLWVLSLLSSFIVYLKTTSRQFGNLEKCFKTWEEDIVRESKELGLRCPISVIKSRMKWAVTVATVVIVTNVAGLTLQAEMYPELASIHYFPLQNSIGAKIGFSVLAVMASALWIIPQAYAMVLSRILTLLFEIFTEKLEQDICSDRCTVPNNFQKLRLLHLKLSKLVSDLDKDLSWFYAADIGFGTGLGVFSLYQIMKTTMDTFTLILFMFWFLASLAIICFASTFAAFTHEAAHGPLDCIYNINVQDISVAKLAQLNLFLSRLTGTQIGFTTSGLLTITKEFILTLAGVFLTYLAVLYTL